MESHDAESRRTADAGFEQSVPNGGGKKALTPTQTVLWSVGILAAFSALFLVLSFLGK